VEEVIKLGSGGRVDGNGWINQEKMDRARWDEEVEKYMLKGRSERLAEGMYL
jgi:hypothetical protein